ncbi:BolA family protein [Gymnodinialimonas ceratoperidinii]|uniref:BolA family transcriptional regulator n=1 Tax=Gymnodinialimonas ceratoperidinii TaxID=2856823 RepID=A0A8F6TU43_9RHOB|nr:BolA family protein [Gymnodinialimonas ceratoperidinii]QXT38715.1 BolA family transcriptional regulator [Gymnodinialimonas ceratoperidinii]
MTTRAEKIEAALRQAFAPRVLEVVDDSEAHRGHAGFQEGGESHFNVFLESEKFQGVSRIARHRMVHDAIGKDLMSEIHALALTLRD